jgi:biopolymer transport protein ExbB
MDPDALLPRLQASFEHALGIWRAGGWAMIPIAVDAFLLFSLGFRVRRRLRARHPRGLREAVWRRWLEVPSERQGPVGAILDLVLARRTVRGAASAFREFLATETASIARDLRVIKVCVGLAPLLGLLGTVTGMLQTFGALASGSGGEKTMQMVAAGISEALITTETGLVVALPGLFFRYLLQRRFDRYEAFLTHLESVVLQFVHARRRRAPSQEPIHGTLP